MRRRRASLCVVVVMRLLLGALAAGSLLLTSGPVAAAPVDRTLPPAGTSFDYQLGGARRVPARVGIVVRDREAAAPGQRYGVCYVNGFQTQRVERRFWRHHWGLVLKDGGDPVVDEAWGEWLLDYRTDAKRDRLARIVGRWLRGCADDGYEAAELDNLDAFTRSHGLVDRSDALAYARRLVRRGHRAGLAVAQKNLAQYDGTRLGYDFAVAEECARWRECGDYVDHYGALVLDVEYRRRDFRRACRRWSDDLAVVRRDLDLSRHGLRRWC